MGLDIFTLDEAARAMWLADPQEEMHVPDPRLAKVCRALAGIVAAIRTGELPILPLPDNLPFERTMLTRDYLDALAAPDDGGEPITVDDDERARWLKAGIEREALAAFAKCRNYEAPILLGDASIAALKDTLSDAEREGLQVMAGRSKGGRKGARTKRQEAMARHQLVIELLDKGRSVAAVAAQTDYSKSQVRRIRASRMY